MLGRVSRLSPSSKTESLVVAAAWLTVEPEWSVAHVPHRKTLFGLHRKGPQVVLDGGELLVIGPVGGQFRLWALSSSPLSVLVLL